MLDSLIWATAALCGLSLLFGWLYYRDVFHPLVLVSPMFAFMYVFMPLQLIEDGQLFVYVSEQQAESYQLTVLGCLAAFIAGCFQASGSGKISPQLRPEHYDGDAIRKGGYIVGSVGLFAWMYAVQGAGGIANVFSQAKGMGWSEFGFIREAAYLLIVGLLLLLSPRGFAPRNGMWRVAVAAFSLPYLIQGLLGAQRGPTFLVCATLGMSWYLARGKRPAITTLMAGGVGLGFLMLFLVMNRGNIYLGSEANLDTDISGFFEANEANEYIFGTGCFIAANEEGRFFWGKRYMAQVLVRPIPKQIWPTKYEDFGVPELLQNAGVAGDGLERIMGWSEIPGAAAGMVADVWVEFSWLSFPFLAFVGWGVGKIWRRAVSEGGPWINILTISTLLSLYFVTQSGEAVIFRAIILTLPCYYVWKKARRVPSQLREAIAV
jgi:hypothetical protein